MESVSNFLFETAFKESLKLKEEGNIKTKLEAFNDALLKYRESILKLIVKPQLSFEKDDFFPLKWMIPLNDQQQKDALKHLAIVFANCSLCFYKENRMLMAYYYANFSFWCDPIYSKARFRLINSCIELLYIFEAQKLLDEWRQIEGDTECIVDLQKKVSKLIATHSSPNKIVDFLRNELELSDEQAYTGPIQLVTIAGKGRGYQATRDINKGEALLIEKGFTYEESNPHFAYFLGRYLNERKDLRSLYVNLFPSEKYPLVDNSEEEERIKFSLKKDPNCLNLPFNDIFTVYQIQKLYTKALKNMIKVFDRSKLFGLYPRFSLVNHSCDPNAQVFFNSKGMILLIARKNIRQGEEITIDYIMKTVNKGKRQELLKPLQFECSCDRCKEKGTWKDKESKINCPGKNDVCDNQLKPIKLDLKDISNFEITFRNKHSMFCPQYIHLLWGIATTLAESRNEIKFSEYFFRIAEVANLIPDYTVLSCLHHLLLTIAIILERDASEKELQTLEPFGLPLNITRQLWNDWKAEGFKGKLLPIYGEIPTKKK